MIKVALPELGEGITKPTVSYWHFQPGQAVKQGEDLVEFTTDKAAFNVPSPSSGKISKILFVEGQSVEVGQALAEIE